MAAELCLGGRFNPFPDPRPTPKNPGVAPGERTRTRDSCCPGASLRLSRPVCKVRPGSPALTAVSRIGHLQVLGRKMNAESQQDPTRRADPAVPAGALRAPPEALSRSHSVPKEVGDSRAERPCGPGDISIRDGTARQASAGLAPGA